MKKIASRLLISVFILLFMVGHALAALSNATVWEIRTNGSNTNGGGFVAGAAGADFSQKNSANATSQGSTTMTGNGGSISSGATTVIVTSAPALFASPQTTLVGDWIKIDSEVMKVTGVSTNTLTITRGQLGTSAASHTDGTTVTNVSNVSTTDLVTAGTTTISTAAGFLSANAVGNIVYIAGGTGAITGGWYQIASVSTSGSSTTAVVDRSTGLTSGTGATLNIGGALQTLQQLQTNWIAANKAFVKADGTYTGTANLALSTGNNNPHNQLIGYTSSRTDGGKFTYQMQTNTGFTGITVSNAIVVRNIIIDCNSLGTSTGLSITNSAAYVWNYKVINCATSAVTKSAGTLLYGEITGTLTGATDNIHSTGGGLTRFFYIHDTHGTGVNGSSTETIEDGVVANTSDALADGVRSSQGYVTRVTVFNAQGDGFNFGASATNWFGPLMLNDLAYGNTGCGFRGNTFATATPAEPMFDGNAFGSNTGGNLCSINDTSGVNGVNPYVYVNNVTLTSNPFVNTGTGDFSLNNTAGGGASARGAGVTFGYPTALGTSHPDMGAYQHPDPGTVSVNQPFSY